MQNNSPAHSPHDHTFGQDRVRVGERRTLIVISITATMMVIEIISGMLFGSMALLADGLHMGSHTAALGITAFAYYYARKHANDKRFSFGTGKLYSLAGFTSSILLALFALLMAWESTNRFFNPVQIIFDQAIVVAFMGLIVNGVSVFILGDRHSRESNIETEGSHSHGHSDHNLRAAHLHVLADALTSLFAIFALIAGKFFGLVWMDPAMGIVGAILVARWSWGLLRETTFVLLDRQASSDIQNTIIEAIEATDGNQITDLHVWSIGPNIYSANISIVTDRPKSPEYYKSLIPNHLSLAHMTVEVHHS